MPAERRIAVIAYLDIVGYTRFLQKNETAMLAEVVALTRELIEPTVADYGGELFKTLGDAALLEFRSAVQAVRWVMQYQRSMATRSFPRIREPVRVRAAVALADVIVENNDRYGMGMNFVARLQRVSPPGGLVIPMMIKGHLTASIASEFREAGKVMLKDIPEPVPIWTWVPEGVPALEAEAETAGRLAALMEIPPRGALSPEKPGVAVLPLQNLTGDASADSEVVAATQELVTALARVPQIFVVDARSVAAVAGRGIDVREVATTLGVRFVVEGSLRRSGQTMRLSAQLVEAETRASLWGDRVDGPAGDSFALQDLLAERVASAVQAAVRAAEADRARLRQVHRLSPNDLVLKAMPSFWTHQRSNNQAALQSLNAALALDPDHPVALGLKSWCLAHEVLFAWAARPEEDRREALDLAQRVLATGTTDSTARVAAASALSILSRDQAQARAVLKAVLASDPGNAWAWLRMGFSHAYDGQHAAALAAFDRVGDLAPTEPLRFSMLAGQGLVHFLRGMDTLALASLELAAELRPRSTWCRAIQAAAAAMAGDLARARTALQAVLDDSPKTTLAALAPGLEAFRPQDRERIKDGLRRAGLPAGNSGGAILADAERIGRRNDPAPPSADESVSVVPFEPRSRRERPGGAGA